MKRGRLLTLLGIILGLLTTVGAFLILRGGTEEPPTPTEVPKQQVLVAVQNIGIAQTIDPATVQLREFDQTQVPSDVVLSPADVAGRLAARDIAQGQMIRRDMLTDKETIVEKGVNASFLIPPGKVAVAFPIDELSSVAYALQSGDVIDMLITIQVVDIDPETQIREPVQRAGDEGQIVGQQEPRMITQLTLQNVAVLKIGPWGQALAQAQAEASPTPPADQQPPADEQAAPPPAPTIMTVLVDQQDALVLKFAREAGASIDFALRGQNFRDVVSTEPVTLEYMLRRFNITPPERFPYALETETLVRP